MNGVCGEFSSPLRSLAAVECASQSWNFIAPHTYIPRKIVFSIWYGGEFHQSPFKGFPPALKQKKKNGATHDGPSEKSNVCWWTHQEELGNMSSLWSLCQIESASRSKNKWASAFECNFFSIWNTQCFRCQSLCCFKSHSQKVILIWEALSCISLLFIYAGLLGLSEVCAFWLSRLVVNNAKIKSWVQGVCLIRFAF